MLRSVRVERRGAEFLLLTWAVASSASLSCADSDAPAGSSSGNGEVSTGAGAGTPDGGAAGQGGGVGGGGAQGGSSSGGGPGTTFDCSPPAGAPPLLELELISDELVEPLGLVAAPGDHDHLYVIEKGGLVRVLESGNLLPEPFLDLSQTVWNYGEAGLLSVAFHPGYEQNGRLFTYYIEQVTDGAQVAEFRRAATNPLQADPAPVSEPLLRMLPASIHLGGTLMFDPTDHYLWLTTGERGNGPWAQDLSVLYGKVLRIDVATTPYTIPPGNLPGGLPEIWNYGLRNPWRASFDPCTGDLYIGDVGEFEREEVNIEPAGSGHRNYGWPIMEGTVCHPVGSACNPSGLTMPAIDHAHPPDPDNFSVVVGGHVYRGPAIPALRGAYLYTNTVGRLYSLRHVGGMITEALELPLTFEGSPFTGVVVSMGQDLEGELYFVDISGRVLKLVHQERSPRARSRFP